MSINLNETGWADENGNALGEWSNGRDIIFGDDTISLDAGLTANTLNGKDIIRNNSDDGGVIIGDNATLNTSGGGDFIFSKGFIGIELGNNAVLDTGNGKDRLFGRGFDGFFLSPSSTIDTGKGNDTISGKGFAVGVGSRGTIKTGDGSDFIFGQADGPDDEFFGSTGIANFQGTIDTGNGNDRVVGRGKGTGIDNSSGTINTGNGNDLVDALTGGFDDPDGTGQINLGAGNDLIRGFGNHKGTVDGGDGFDTAELGFSYDESLISFGSNGSASLDITYESATMSFTNFETFGFDGQEFSLEQLQAEI